MKLTISSILVLLSALATAQLEESPINPGNPSIILHNVTTTGTGCPPTTSSNSSLEVLGAHNIAQLKHTFSTTASYGPSIQHTDSFRMCKLTATLSYLPTYDLSITYWNRTISTIALENPKITAVNNEYLWFDNQRYYPDGFIFGVKTFTGPLETKDVKAPFFPVDRKLTVPPAECGTSSSAKVEGGRRYVQLNLESQVNIQGSNGATPRTGNPGAPVGTFGGEVGYSVQLVWNKSEGC
ncbi:hypothetical protein BJ508DRAFT_417629 [Ascobolus immersus RN42]|uniref:Uncharacterized protein n=1 Tax=Ascobolus immersus RN42 TaxID=1160509 RepID=A0A3N4HUY3_ASCIM|nr:hypothetical protein BJ508DRAFT_417629 [Ascobolus immersus RN42]